MNANYMNLCELFNYSIPHSLYEVIGLNDFWEINVHKFRKDKISFNTIEMIEHLSNKDVNITGLCYDFFSKNLWVWGREEYKLDLKTTSKLRNEHLKESYERFKSTDLTLK